MRSSFADRAADFSLEPSAFFTLLSRMRSFRSSAASAAALKNMLADELVSLGTP